MCPIHTINSSADRAKTQYLEILLWVFRVLGRDPPKTKVLSTYLGGGRRSPRGGVGGGGPPAHRNIIVSLFFELVRHELGKGFVLFFFFIICVTFGSGCNLSSIKFRKCFV